MDKLLMLGTSNLSVEIVRLARSKGIYTITTDYLEPERSAAKQISDEYWMINTADIDALEKKCREEGVTAVITGVSEDNIEFMMRLCARLDLPCYCTPETWYTVQRKHNFKKLCRDNGVPVATDYFLSNPPTQEELDSIVFPVVVKPVDCGSNIGMSYCYSKEEVVKACAFARSWSNEETVIVERMLHGLEYTAYYALADGEASLISLVPEYSQPGYPENCYSLITSATNKLPYYTTYIEPQVKQLLKNAGCREGIAWIQLFLDEDGQFYAIEMGYRLSGDMLCLAQRDTYGFDSMNWLLEIALGKKHTREDLPLPVTYDGTRCACSYILWSKSAGTVSRVEGLDQISALPKMYLRSLAHEGFAFRQYQYLVVLVFSADSMEDMCRTIQKVNDTIKVYDENGNNAAIYYTDFAHLKDLYEQGLV